MKLFNNEAKHRYETDMFHINTDMKHIWKNLETKHTNALSVYLPSYRWPMFQESMQKWRKMSYNT